ncbi:helix-turn-helix domain-containing protein [Tropicimonas isoalkanivorans]|uniref:DNA binding domain-containing protein, excisionase family n=1 Tax=Tropicimonas isoalkanivorans TaxID=441112 RepID=A0A1I1Q490_9RHOB|nr:helix-turn-helix domain-containing protein [Tropicimonas isoalkanivorans]SFD14688.1 DNA binding domain-containing protein, excisionase family [Tropicimonas isoalkanivorans]
MNAAANVVDFGDRLPTPEEIDSAAEALTAIENQRATDGALAIGDAVLSGSLVDLLTDVLSVVARGDTLTLVPLSRRLTTQEAADLLNVSRPFLVKLIDRKELDHVMVGTHRRLSLRDVLDYKARRSEGRKSALSEMQAIAEDLDDQ